jgi:DNA (cytosine-5)-methyltransferase 1
MQSLQRAFDFIHDPNQLKFIDLFAGLGSFRLGFEAQGARCVFSSDIDQVVSKAYREAHGDDCLNDILAQSIDDLPDFDILCGGFPCQPFSAAGRMLAFDDERAATAFKTIEIIKARQPMAFVLENVKGIQTYKAALGDSPLNVLIGMLEDCGYAVKAHLLNAWTHGALPQNRERYFFVGYRNDLEINLAQTMSAVDLDHDYRKHLDSLESVDTKHLYTRERRPKIEWVHDLLSDFVKASDCADYVYQIRNSGHTVRRHSVPGRVPTLTKFMGTGGHNVPLIYQDKTWRKLTPRECLRLQGFSDDYKMSAKISDSAYYCMAGNSIPVTLSERIAHLIVSSLSS